jgi:hypothetical protein
MHGQQNIKLGAVKARATYASKSSRCVRNA